jgi:hypothetical protein
MSLTISFFIFINVPPNTQAQTVMTFTPADKFEIPELNGTISFAINGSYSEATLKNNTWEFRDLTLNNQSIADFGLTNLNSIGDLKISTQNSNVTIVAYLTFNYSFPVNLLRYSVEGKGKQLVNLGLNSSRPSDVTEWSVIVSDNVFLTEGQSWTLLPDDTLDITHTASNITVAHFDYLNSIDSNLLFYIKHSVALTAAAALVIVVSLAIIIKARTRKPKECPN